MRAARRGHRSGRHRRRARVRLPLLLARLPDPAAPRGRRLVHGRPDRLRVARAAAATRSRAPSGSCTPRPRTCPASTRSGSTPTALFDTELAGRLLGYPRVGLATLVETLLGFRLAKEHSAVDWSTRPLPVPWLEYAALDVEVLVELRDLLAAELVETGKDEWARQEFDYLRSFVPAVRTDAWRRTSGVHRVRGRRALAAVRELWETRNEIAEQRDVTPGPDPPRRRDRRRRHRAADRPRRADGHQGLPRPRRRPLRLPLGRRPRAAPPSSTRTTCRPARPRGDGPPLPRAWAEKDPVAARRLVLAREALTALAEEQHLPVENVLTPDYLRRTLWTPPKTREPEALADAVAEQLAGYGARPWQIELAGPVLVDAILTADVEPEIVVPPAALTDD